MKMLVDSRGNLMKNSLFRTRKKIRGWRWIWLVPQIVLCISHFIMKYGLGVRAAWLLWSPVFVQWGFLYWQISSQPFRGIPIDFWHGAVSVGECVTSTGGKLWPNTVYGLIYKEDVKENEYSTFWFFPLYRSRYERINRLKVMGIKLLVRIHVIK